MKKIIVFIFWVHSLVLYAQHEEPKRFVWGMLTGIEQHRLSIQSITSKVSMPDSPRAFAERTGSAGAVLGTFGRWKIYRDLSVQTELLFSYAQNIVRFYPDNTQEKHRFADMEIPIHLVVTNAQNRLPIRASFLVGGRMGWNFASRSSENLNFLQERLAADVGLGAEIRVHQYRIQPEVVYSYGLNNLHNYLNTPFDPGISSVVRDRITLRILVWR